VEGGGSDLGVTPRAVVLGVSEVFCTGIPTLL
jgi:hypothetical protein